MTVTEISLEQESRDRYLTYALSVVSGRALPDVRDGLKPVQRRILYAMSQSLNLKPSGGHRKSATVVGAVLGSFHPHGDLACYEAMVRMAQDFSLRYPLVDGQGNFGSLDGDNAAAYRYTEVRLQEIALEVIGEIDQETVAFRDNFDSTTAEPVVLPSRVPNLLINGATGIAVGMATSIPPHNLKDVVKSLLELMQDPEISDAKLVSCIKGPDFPTGCSVLNSSKELQEIYRTGRGSIRMRGEWRVEEVQRGKQIIVVTSIPYAIQKGTLVERIAGLIIERKVPQLVDVRDESTDEVRIVLELAPAADPEVAMAYLFKNTPLESNFAVNLTALIPVPGTAMCRPELLSLRKCLEHFLAFREEVTEKRLSFEKRKLLERVHILLGFVAIFDDLDEAIRIVRKSEGRADAASGLQKRFKLSEIQSLAVVDMRIYQLARTNIDEIRAELLGKEKRIKVIDSILGNRKAVQDIVRKELEEISEKYGDKRYSKLVKDSVDIEFNEEAYVVHEDVYALITSDGWIKRIRQSNDVASTRVREGDTLLHAHPLSTRDAVAMFTNMGSIYVIKVSDFPASGGYGTPVQKILKFKDGERIISTFSVVGAKQETPKQTELSLPTNASSPAILKDGDIVALIAGDGTGFCLTLSELSGLKRSGKRAIKLKEGQELRVAVPVDDLLVMVTKKGSALAVKRAEIPVRDSAAVGVSIIDVRDDDVLVGGKAFAAKDKTAHISVVLSTGKKREIPLKDVTHGHRGLKGTKIVSRDEVTAVE